MWWMTTTPGYGPADVGRAKYASISSPPWPVIVTVSAIIGVSVAIGREPYVGFSQTETCEVLSLVNGARCQSLHRSRNRRPAMRAIRSNSAGHAKR